MRTDYYRTILRNRVWWIISLGFIFSHPFYLSVTDIKFNDSKKTLEISCKLFTNDIEDALKKSAKTKLDILHPKDKKEIDAVLFNYIKNHLRISVNGKALAYIYLGYEKEEDAIVVYLEAVKISKPTLITIDNKLLYDYLGSQVNIVHAEVLGQKQSFKVGNPESVMKFEFK
jgi:hypothetical protein